MKATLIVLFLIQLYSAPKEDGDVLALVCKRLHDVLKEELCSGWGKGVLSPDSALSQIIPIHKIIIL